MEVVAVWYVKCGGLVVSAPANSSARPEFETRPGGLSTEWFAGRQITLWTLYNKFVKLRPVGRKLKINSVVGILDILKGQSHKILDFFVKNLCLCHLWKGKNDYADTQIFNFEIEYLHENEKKSRNGFLLVHMGHR